MTRRTERFVLELTVDDEAEGFPQASDDAADELHDYLSDLDGWPAWVFSVDTVDPARLEAWP